MWIHSDIHMCFHSKAPEINLVFHAYHSGETPKAHFFVVLCFVHGCMFMCHCMLTFFVLRLQRQVDTGRMFIVEHDYYKLQNNLNLHMQLSLKNRSK